MRYLVFITNHKKLMSSNLKTAISRRSIVNSKLKAEIIVRFVSDNLGVIEDFMADIGDLDIDLDIDDLVIDEE